MSAGEYERFLAERKMAIARTALESIANREVCVRNWLLGIMFMQGLLGDWQGTELDSPCIESLQLFLLKVFNSIQRRLSRAAERGI